MKQWLLLCSKLKTVTAEDLCCCHADVQYLMLDGEQGEIVLGILVYIW